MEGLPIQGRSLKSEIGVLAVQQPLSIVPLLHRVRQAVERLLQDALDLRRRKIVEGEVQPDGEQPVQDRCRALSEGDLLDHSAEGLNSAGRSEPTCSSTRTVTAWVESQRATKLKHAPLHEYRDSPYRRSAPGETEYRGERVVTPKLMMVGSAPKKAIAGAALRMPSGVNKTEINQLVSVPVEYCPLWGIPRLDMAVVRMAGISRTPDIRTRARLEQWAMRVPVGWIEPMLNVTKVGTLAIAAGFICGVGDWRIEKGGPNGGFRLVEEDDPELRHIIETGGYMAQEEALQNPECSGDETRELMDWYLDELARRGLKPEDEKPEEIEVDPDGPMTFGAGEEHLAAPDGSVSRLSVQNGAES